MFGFDFPDPVPFPRSYWIVPGRFLGGCYPGSENHHEARQKLKGLLDHGIRHVINLMEPDEFNLDRKPFVPYEIQMKSIAKSMGVDVSFERIPIRDMRTPSRIEMIRILDQIDDNIEKGRPVYNYCWDSFLDDLPLICYSATEYLIYENNQLLH